MTYSKGKRDGHGYVYEKYSVHTHTHTHTTFILLDYFQGRKLYALKYYLCNQNNLF